MRTAFNTIALSRKPEFHDPLPRDLLVGLLSHPLVTESLPRSSFELVEAHLPGLGRAVQVNGNVDEPEADGPAPYRSRHDASYSETLKQTVVTKRAILRSQQVTAL